MTSDRDQDWNWAGDMGGIGRVEREEHGVDGGEQRATGTRCRTCACQLPLWVAGAERRPDFTRTGRQALTSSVSQSVLPQDGRDGHDGQEREKEPPAPS